ncbi:hypothetical protein COOONC_13301, partial [Cooperia oncophora]
LVRLITIFAISSPFVTCCQQTLLIPTSVIQCDHSKSNCSNHTTLIAQLNPMQPELCIQLQQGGHQLHFMRISFRNTILYFTRNTITKVQYQKRCPHMGTCTGLKCAKITFNSLVDELLDANNYTGITYCSESCGGLGCSCGYPSSGCLFYRIYHVPVDDNIYEVFQCPSWLRTISYACSSDPRHNQTIHDHTNRIIKDTCNCNPAKDSVNCYCTNNNVSRITQSQNTFPLPIPEGLVSTQGRNNIPTITTRAVSVQLMITFNHTIKEITQEIQNFQCSILPQRLFGCYNCVKGSVATLFCKSDSIHATAQISCGLQQFILTCTKQGTKHVEHNVENRHRFSTLNYVNGFNAIMALCPLMDKKYFH